MSRLVIIGLLFCIFLSYFLVLSFSNFFLIWVSLEIGTFCVVPLLFLRGRSRRVEARLKYFIFNVVAALIFLFGGLLFSFRCASTFSMFSLRGLGSFDFVSSSYSVFFSERLIIGGLLIKLGLFPFHA